MTVTRAGALTEVGAIDLIFESRVHNVPRGDDVESWRIKDDSRE